MIFSQNKWFFFLQIYWFFSKILSIFFPVFSPNLKSNHFTRFFYFYRFFIFIRRPTFKTATPTSRTQLKQQLQREQLQELERQELERRENERKLSMQGHGSNTSIDHSQMAHSSHSSPQLQVPRNCTAGIPQMYTSSPTPSTSTEGSEFTSGHYSNQSHPHLNSHPNSSSNISPNPMPQQTDLSTAQLKVPLHIGVDLPPQVLKVNNGNTCCNKLNFMWIKWHAIILK